MGADSKSQTPPTSQALCTTVATLALLLSIACCALHVYVLQDLQRVKGTSARENILLQKMATYVEILEKPQLSTLPSAGGHGNYSSHEDQNKTRVKRTAVGTGGSVYVRWGRTVCPTTAALVYSGIAAGSHYSHSGGGAEKLCLPTTPQWGRYQSGIDGNKYKSYIYGTEYQSDITNIFSKANANGARLHDHDVPCAVCHSPHSSQLMIPALMYCPHTWTKEYSGYLMTEQYDHPGRSSFDCVDAAPETVQGGIQNQNGALFYFVEAVCGSLPCPNYISGRELTCVVCTK